MFPDTLYELFMCLAIPMSLFFIVECFIWIIFYI